MALSGGNVRVQGRGGWGSIQNKGGAELLKMKGKFSIGKYFVNYNLRKGDFPPRASIARTPDFVPSCDVLSLERQRTNKDGLVTIKTELNMHWWMR